MVHIHDLATVLRGQHSIVSCLDVDALVHLLLTAAHRIGTHTKGRGNKEKLITLDGEGIFASRNEIPLLTNTWIASISCLMVLQWIILYPELPSLGTHLLHHLPVIPIKSVGLNDGLEVLGVRAAGSIACTSDAFSPALIVIGERA